MLETVTKPEVAFSDDRGDITNILDEPITHVAVITSAAGAVRGNHYHPWSAGVSRAMPRT